MSNSPNLADTLTRLLGRAEHEVVEFKKAERQFDSDKLGEYFSALSNEANLKDAPHAWLVMGIDPATHQPLMPRGTQAYALLDHRNIAKQQVAEHTSPNLSFMDIHEHVTAEGARLLLFQIPAAPRGMPVAWKGHHFARNGESLHGLSIEKIERIRAQAKANDWSQALCPDATLADLSPEAVAKARKEYAQKHAAKPGLLDELASWDDATFLAKLRLSQNGRLTRAALLLLGKPEASHHLGSSPRFTWVLYGPNGVQQDYEHFGLPFILMPEAIWGKIRNLNVRDMPDGSLFPRELRQYDAWVFREALHNAIAHQDYLLGARASVAEHPDRLLITSPGAFFLEGGPDAARQSNAPPSRYRNTHLAQAMVDLNLIDTIGSGILRMHREQAKRAFPMPDFRLTPASVAVTLPGTIIDPAFSQLLLARTDLPLEQVILLDRIQKEGQLADTENERRLRQDGLIEGRRPRLRITARVARAVGFEAKHTLRKGLDRTGAMTLLRQHLADHGPQSRMTIDAVLIKLAPDDMSSDQKKTWVRNLLQEMRRRRQIQPVSTKARGPNAQWQLSPAPSEPPAGSSVDNSYTLK